LNIMILREVILVSEQCKILWGNLERKIGNGNKVLVIEL